MAMQNICIAVLSISTGKACMAYATFSTVTLKD